MGRIDGYEEFPPLRKITEDKWSTVVLKNNKKKKTFEEANRGNSTERSVMEQ